MLQESLEKQIRMPIKHTRRQSMLTSSKSQWGVPLNNMWNTYMEVISAGTPQQVQ